MNAIGRSITSSFAFVSSVGEECEALSQLIRQEVSALFLKVPRVSRLTPGKWTSRYRSAGIGWVYSDLACSIALIPAGKEEATAYLSFQLSLLCDNPEGGSIAEPLLHINYWEVAVDHNLGEYMGSPITGMTQATMDQLRDGCARLLRWPASKGKPDWWTYSLRLAEINSLVDVRELIIAPVEKLLSDLDKGEALLAGLPQVINYSPLKDHPDYYQAS